MVAPVGVVGHFAENICFAQLSYVLLYINVQNPCLSVILDIASI
jgi:hypothetical protein